MFRRQRDRDKEIHELRTALFGHIERAQKAAEVERRRKAALLDTLLEIKEWKAKAGTLGQDNMTKLLAALEGWLDA